MNNTTNKTKLQTSTTTAITKTFDYVYMFVIFMLLAGLVFVVVIFENVIPSMRQSILHPVFGFAIAIFIIWQISDFIGKKDRFFGYEFEKGKIVYVSVILLIFFVLGL